MWENKKHELEEGKWEDSKNVKRVNMRRKDEKRENEGSKIWREKNNKENGRIKRI